MFNSSKKHALAILENCRLVQVPRVPSLQTLLTMRDGEVDDLMGRPRRPQTSLGPTSTFLPDPPRPTKWKEGTQGKEGKERPGRMRQANKFSLQALSLVRKPTPSSLQLGGASPGQKMSPKAGRNRVLPCKSLEPNQGGSEAEAQSPGVAKPLPAPGEAGHESLQELTAECQRRGLSVPEKATRGHLMLLIREAKITPIDDTVVIYGCHKGRLYKEVPQQYLDWAVKEVKTNENAGEELRKLANWTMRRQVSRAES